MERKFMEAAIEAASLCTSIGAPKDLALAPPVGSVLVASGTCLATGYRGERGEGTHAEENVLAKLAEELDSMTPSDMTLYTTFEPGTYRSSAAVPDAERIAEAGITDVCIGVLDPNRVMRGNGHWYLRRRGVRVGFFELDLATRVREQLRAYITEYEPLDWHPSPVERSLDDWYYSLRSIYADRNETRDAMWILAHLTETLGGLSILITEKPGKSERFDIREYVAKCLAWWLALCDKLGIRSVENLLWLKFPNVCPYCQLEKHDDDPCLAAKRARGYPDWEALAQLASDRSKMPKTLEEWLAMFKRIYSIGHSHSAATAFGRLTEEIGELAESIRNLSVSRNSIVSELGDVFAWIMHVVAVHNAKHQKDPIALSEIMYDWYPDRCRSCKDVICSCPPVLHSTINRLAHEGPSDELVDSLGLFQSSEERGQLFGPGAAEIRIGAKSFAASGGFLASLYDLAQGLREALRTAPDLSDRLSTTLDHWCTRTLATVGRQRIREEPFREITMALLDPHNSTIMKGLLEGLPDSDLASALIAAGR